MRKERVRQADLVKVTVAFQKFANTPKVIWSHVRIILKFFTSYDYYSWRQELNYCRCFMYSRSKSSRNTVIKQAEKPEVEARQYEAFKLQENGLQCITESFLI